MPSYNWNGTTTRIAPERATALATAVLERVGAPAEHAAAQAAHLVDGDLSGRASHGLQRLPVLHARIVNGLLDPSAEPELSWPTASFLAVDARNGFGCVAAHRAIEALEGAAARTGVAVAAIRRAGHLGMLAPYVESVARRGRVGIALTTSEALVHPAGGRTALVGTNPIGVGVPAHPEPFVLDMSTAAISAGEIIAQERRGGELPPGRAVDAEGRPTTSPSRALEGSISPFGGAKGYGLALAIELLVAWASTTALGTAVRGTLDAEHPVTKGDLLLVLDPSACGLPDPAAFVSGYLAELRTAPTAPGIDAVAIPGDRMRAERARRAVEGIPYPDALWRELRALAGEAEGAQRHG